MLRELGAIPANAGILDEMGHGNPTDAQFREAKLAVKDLKPGGPWLSEIIDAIAIEKLRTKEWSENTWERLYRPLLRDFREIVSNEKRTFTDKDGTYKTIWDIHARELEEEHIDSFCEAMWKYPRSYGSTKNAGEAKQALNSGLPPQDRANGIKKIGMIKTFLKWAYKKIITSLGRVATCRKSR